MAAISNPTASIAPIEKKDISIKNPVSKATDEPNTTVSSSEPVETRFE
jgi:hypothetical protein